MLVGIKNAHWQCNLCRLVRKVCYDLRCEHCFPASGRHCDLGWDDRCWYCQKCWLQWIGPCPQCVQPARISPIQSQDHDQECWRHLPFEIMTCLGTQTHHCQRCHNALATTCKHIHRWFYTRYDSTDDEPNQDTSFADAATQTTATQRPDTSWYCRHCWLKWEHGSSGTVAVKSSFGSAVQHARVPPLELVNIQHLCDQVDVGHHLLTCRAVYSLAKMEDAKARYADEGGDVRFHEICLCP